MNTHVPGFQTFFFCFFIILYCSNNPTTAYELTVRCVARVGCGLAAVSVELVTWETK